MRLHAAFLGVLLLLGATALFPTRSGAYDLVTGEPVAGTHLEPIAPMLGAILEPVYGPLHAITGLPDFRVLSWLGWLTVTVLVARFFRLGRRGELRARWFSEILLAAGYITPYVVTVLALICIGLVPKSFSAAVLFGVPAVAYTLTLGVLLFRVPRDRRRTVVVGFTMRCIGILGCFSVALLAFFLVMPATFQTGRRLVSPSGFLTLDIHGHTQRSKDAIVGPAERLDFLDLHHIDLAAVTEHDCFDTPDPGENGSYETMREMASARAPGVLPLPGEEFTTHALHLVLLGVRRTFHPGTYRLSSSKEKPPYYGYDYRRLIGDVHREGGYVVVAHWWTHRQWDRVDWKLLVDYGVDGFEIMNGPEIAPRDLIDEWRKTGLPLFSASDFHGWRKSMYGWTLVDRAILNDPSPYAVIRGIFSGKPMRVVASRAYDPLVPSILEPPVGLWRYFTGLAPPNRAVWFGFSTLVWAVLVLRATRRQQTDVLPNGQEPIPQGARTRGGAVPVVG